MSAKVSVIIPIYKAEEYIGQCAKSLFEQTLQDMEFIFVDDCSPDNCEQILAEILAQYPSRKHQVHYLKHKCNLGSGASRNTGLSFATGEFIGYCDSDDWCHPEMYQIMYNRAKKECADIVFCDFNFAYAKGLIIYRTPSLSIDKTEFLRGYIKNTWTVLWNTIASRKLYEQFSIRFPEDISYCEDFHVTTRLFYYAVKIAKVERPLYYYNQQNSTSIVHNMNRKAEIDEQRTYLEIIAFFKEQGVLDLYHQEMCWRVLKSTQDVAVCYDRYKDFVSLYPPSHKYIWNCPYGLNLKSRIIMTLLAIAPLRWLGISLVFIRHILKR